MAVSCFPSTLYGCMLHCFDTEDEEAGEWYESNPACAVVVDPHLDHELVEMIRKGRASIQEVTRLVNQNDLFGSKRRVKDFIRSRINDNLGVSRQQAQQPYNLVTLKIRY